MTEPASTASAELSPEVAKIRDGYTFEEPAIELGVVMENDTPVPEAVVRIPLSMLNRHGLVAGATGTGKTKTLQLMAEQISAAGVPVFAADIKGDLSGIASLDSQGTSCWRGPGRSVRTGSRGPVRSSSSLWVAGAWESRSARR
jgi:hypothetical protein